MKKTPRLVRRILATSVTALIAGAPCAFATDYTFIPATGTVTWNDGNNWNTLPADDATFPSLAGDFANLIKDFTGATTIQLNAGITLGRLDLGDNANTAQALTLGNTGGTQTITFDNLGAGAALNVANAGGGNVTIANNLTLADDLTVATGNRQLQFTGPVFDLGANTLSFAGTGGGTVLVGAFNTTGASLGGTGDVLVNMGSTTAPIAFFGLNTFSGGVTLQGGQLVPGRSSIGVDAGVTSGALGTGTLTITGGGTFASRVIRPSTSGNFTIGNSVAANADFSIGNTGTAQSLNFAGTMTLGGDRIIGVENGSGNHTISGVIADGGGGFGITKTGANPLRLSGASTYTGVTRVANSALFVHGDALVNTPGPLGDASSAVELGVSGLSPANAGIALRGAVNGMTIARDILVTNHNSTGFTNIGNDTTQNVTFSGAITLQRSLNFSSRGATGIVDVTGVVSGGFGIAAIDGGATRLSAVNTYTGTTTVRNGTLIAGGNVAPSTDGVLGNSATAILLADSGSVAGNNVTLSIGGAFEISRDVTVNSNNGAGVSKLTAQNAAATVATYSGQITLNRGVTLGSETAGATTRFATPLIEAGGARSVTVTGPGTVEFAQTSANAYTGITTISSGTLLLNATPGLGLGGGAIVGDGNTATPDIALAGGTLRWAGNHQVDDNAVLQMSGGILDLAGFTETIYDFDYTGGAIVNAGGFTITNSADLFLFDGTNAGTPVTLDRNLLYVGTTTQATVTAQLSLDADPMHDFSVNDGTAAVDVLISGSIVNATTPSSIVKRGGGTLKLTATNTFGGVGAAVTIQGGTLAVTADDQLGDAANSITFTGGALRFDSAFATTRTFNVTASGGGVDAPTGVTVTLNTAGQIAGNGVFAKRGAGTLVLAADHSASWTGGSVLIEQGVLSISAGNQLGAGATGVSLAGGVLEVTTGFTAEPARIITTGPAGGTIRVSAGQTLALNAPGQIAGAGALLLDGAGTLVLGAANTGVSAGASVNIAAGTLELSAATALGSTSKALITTSGGTLRLTSDTATSFGNALVLSGDSSIVSNTATPGSPGVTHTLGGATLGGFTLTALAGANVTGGAPALTLGPLVLTGDATLNASTAQFIQTATTHPTNLGGHTITVTGPQNTQLAVISNGPGFGSDAIVKNGTGTLILPNSNSTFQGDIELNDGFIRFNAVTSGTPLGNTGNTVNLNGGALVMAASPANGYTLKFNGGTLASTGANRDWNGQAASSGPSLIFTADTVFDLNDPFTPGTARDINIGLDDGTSGLLSSTGPVDIAVFAPASNATSQNKVRLRQTSVQGTVSGTVTIHQNAIFQIRGIGAVTALGTSDLLLDTGINLVSSLNAGRLELVSSVPTHFDHHVELLGDSTIGLFTVFGGTNHTLTIASLTLGAKTLSVTHGSGSYDLEVTGTTTLTGNATFRVPNTATDLTLNAITETGGARGFTKNGGGLLRLKSPAGFTGEITLAEGTLVTAVPNALPASPLTVLAGTLDLAANDQTVDTLAITGGTITGTGILTTTGVNALAGTINTPLAGTGGLFKSGGGTLTLGGANTFSGGITIIGGLLQLGADNVIPDAATVTVGPGTFNFHSGGTSNRTDTLAGLTVLPGGTVGTAAGTVPTPSLITITGTLDVRGGTFIINSGSSLTAAKAIFSGEVQNVHILGGNSAIQVNEFTIGPGGIEFTGTNLRMNTGDDGTRLGSRVVLGGDVTSFASLNTAGFFNQSAGAGFGVREISLGTGARTFTIADGFAPTDFRVQFPLTGTADLQKEGPGSLLLEAFNTYTGNTIIAGGTLILTGSITASPVTVVSTGGTLTGTGSTATLAVSGGTLAPGVSSTGILTASEVILDGGTFAVEIFGVAPGFTYDQLQASGSITLQSHTALTLDLGAFDPLDDGSDTFTIASAFIGVSGSGLLVHDGNPLSEGEAFTVPTLFGSQEFTITYTANGGRDIVLTAVPEPGSALLLLGGLALLARRRREKNTPPR